MDPLPSNAVALGGRKQRLLSIMQINLHHCKAAAAELLLSLSKAEVDIALVQESYIYNNRVTGLGSGQYVSYAISNGDKWRRRYGISLYLPYERPDAPGHEVEELLEDLADKGHIIIGCDANAHHFQWGSNDINVRCGLDMQAVSQNDTYFGI
ncbi:uncharacterized protein LOC109612854 [Musca domestica]|uniref:Uncharacterized protein LOC109612854 n=1 Tax=Musca domestica TaxID=7370 RepID=A0A9J7DIS9_MUSDO|nr:uncharacterized protein LOC109612854 [Musca domestica]